MIDFEHNDVFEFTDPFLLKAIEKYKCAISIYIGVNGKDNYERCINNNYFSWIP